MTNQPTTPLTPPEAQPVLRAASWDDLEAVAQFIYATCEAEGDTGVAVSPEELANEWKYEGFDPRQDAFITLAPGGQVTGYAALYDIGAHCSLNGDLYLHPRLTSAGAAQALLNAMQTRAQEHIRLAPPGERVFIRVQLDNKDEAGKSIFQQHGYAPARYHWRMGIELQRAPNLAALPAGLEVTPFAWEAHARAVWQARNEAFSQNWGSRPLSFEDFTYYNFDEPQYDPALWVVIWQGGEVAGFAINHNRMGIGWVQTLGVRPVWRGMGLGAALLSRSFDAFYQRGMRSIGLGVDASNPTGATELYRKAGMRIVNEFVTLEKELRPAHAAPA